MKKNITTLPKLLLDANLSGQTADALRKIGFDVFSLVEEHLYALPDEEIAQLAREKRRIVVTFDADFARIWHEQKGVKIGVVHLRLRDQFVGSVNHALSQFFQLVVSGDIDLYAKLVVLRDGRFKIIP